MSKQRISAEHGVCNGIFLMIVKLNICIHHRKGKLRTVIFTRTDRIEKGIVFLYNCFTSFRILKNPLLKGFFQLFCLFLYNSCGINIHNTFFFRIAHAIGNFYCLIDFWLFQIQQMLHDFIGIHVSGSVLLSGNNGIILILIIDMPGAGMF